MKNTLIFISKHQLNPYSHHSSSHTYFFVISLLLSPLYSSPSLGATAQDTNSRPNLLHTGGLVLLSVFALLGYVALYLIFKHCLQPWVQHSLERQARVGLDPSVLETFPIFLHSNMVGLGFNPTISPVECSICLGFYEGDDKLRLLPKCGHVFHVDCVDSWLASHSTCPLCRADLVPRPDESKDVESGCVAGLGGAHGGVNAVANDVVVEAKQEIGGTVKQPKKIWRWNSTGHVARCERMMEMENLTKDSWTSPRELKRSNSCIIILN